MPLQRPECGPGCPVGPWGTWGEKQKLNLPLSLPLRPPQVSQGFAPLATTACGHTGFSTELFLSTRSNNAQKESSSMLGAPTTSLHTHKPRLVSVGSPRYRSSQSNSCLLRGSLGPLILHRAKSPKLPRLSSCWPGADRRVWWGRRGACFLYAVPLCRQVRFWGWRGGKTGVTI